MALRRVFVDSIARGVSRVEGARAHHFHRVARLTVGDKDEISDQKQVFRAVVKRSRADLVEFDVRQELEAPGQGIAVVLLLSIIKFARFEWAIEKATELGVQTIVPVVAERSDRRLVAGARKRSGRWRKIAFEAAYARVAQSLRMQVQVLRVDDETVHYVKLDSQRRSVGPERAVSVVGFLANFMLDAAL